MNKDYVIAIVLVVLAVGIFYLSSAKNNQNKNTNSSKEESKNEVQPKKEEISDLKIEVLKQGSGEVVSKNGDILTVNYVGTLEDGTKFDSSLDRGVPFKLNLGTGETIKGWDQGLVGMKIGEKRKLTIPSKLAYGERGAGNLIPPNTTLIFEVELLGIEEPKKEVQPKKEEATDSKIETLK